VGPDPLIDPTYPTDPASAQFVPPSESPLASAPTLDCRTLDVALDTTDWVGGFEPVAGTAGNWLAEAPLSHVVGSPQPVQCDRVPGAHLLPLVVVRQPRP
jgi:hypothetical protein